MTISRYIFVFLPQFLPHSRPNALRIKLSPYISPYRNIYLRVYCDHLPFLPPSHGATISAFFLSSFATTSHCCSVNFCASYSVFFVAATGVTQPRASIPCRSSRAVVARCLSGPDSPPRACVHPAEPHPRARPFGALCTGPPPPSPGRGCRGRRSRCGTPPCGGGIPCAPHASCRRHGGTQQLLRGVYRHSRT